MPSIAKANRPSRSATHRCEACGASSPKWAGRCPGCGEWNSLVEEVARPAPWAGEVLAGMGADPDRPEPVGSVDTARHHPRPTGLAEFDRVLGGGLVPASVTLLGGEPGAGKSTLLLQVAGMVAAAGARVLLVSAEESKPQVRLRAERLGVGGDELLVLSETSLPALLSAAADVQPDLLVVDSIQTVLDPALDAPPGSVAQVRHCAHQLVVATKAAGWATVAVGHVTKEGTLAGPRVLEHVVDTVLAFDGDRHQALRVLRASKHRFGSTGELGLFEMGETGLSGVADASRFLLGDRRPGVAGSAIVPAIEGGRPVLVEVQALVHSGGLAIPRRASQGLDARRLDVLLAVLDRRAGVSLSKLDVYASAVGGLRIAEPAADLGICLAVASATSGTPVPESLVACGEVGLAGEVRQVAHLARRLSEVARLGFTEAVVPASTEDAPPGLRLHRARTVRDVVELTERCG